MGMILEHWRPSKWVCFRILTTNIGALISQVNPRGICTCPFFELLCFMFFLTADLVSFFTTLYVSYMTYQPLNTTYNHNSFNVTYYEYHIHIPFINNVIIYMFSNYRYKTITNHSYYLQIHYSVTQNINTFPYRKHL